MKNIKTLLLSLLFLVALGSSSYAQLKVGYMNPQEVLSKLTEVQDIEKRINDIITQSDNQLSAEAADLQRQFAEYEQNRDSMTADEQDAEEKRLSDLDTEFQKRRDTLQNSINQQRAQLMQPVINKVNTALEAVAKEMGLDIILNEATSLGDAIVFFASEEKLNVTDLVVAKVLEQ